MAVIDKDLNHAINSLRLLSVDMIRVAGSGHPGIALGAAPIIYTLYQNHLKINPADPDWVNRDRFILSAGHGSALLYACLFMAGYEITLDDLQAFRKIDSKCPGHPELGTTPGVDCTTGPLGQGLATAVGIALGERYIASYIGSKVKRQELINYYTYVLASDGDLMEGVATEAAAIAGTQGLGKLIVLYDSNDITLDGELGLSSKEDITKKYDALGWHVDYVNEGNDPKEIDKAIMRAKKVTGKPSLIEIKTVIGRGSYNEGKNIVHGKPLTKDDIDNLRMKMGITTNTMEIEERAINNMRKPIVERVKEEYKPWVEYFNKFKTSSNADIVKIVRFLEFGELSVNFDARNFQIQPNYNEELRESNSKIMNVISDRTPFFLGGSADLSSSCKTNLYKEAELTKQYQLGKNIYFGVREHAMGAILNGMALCGLKVFGSTFLAFSDYLKPAIRMSAMMSLPVTYIFTHDSIAVGPDGATHEPVEQLTALRTIPNLNVIRPADINEVIGSWDYILKSKKPTCLIISKQMQHILAGTSSLDVSKGAYIVSREQARIDALIISSGTDITTSCLIKEELKNLGKDVRVVSMPSINIFLEQAIEYQKEIIPPNVKIIVIEASDKTPWFRFTTPDNVLGISDFGFSGDSEDVLKKMEFDYNTIKNKVVKLINN